MANTKYAVAIAVLCYVVICNADDSTSGQLVARAISDFVCFDARWQDKSSFQLGKPEKFDYVINGSQLSVRTKSLVSIEGIEMVTFLDGAIDKTGSVIWNSESYNPEVMVANAYYKARQARYSDSRTVRKIDVALPQSCNEVFEPLTGKKALMVTTIEKTIKATLDSDESHQGQQLKKTEVVIGDFETNDPDTYAYVPDTGALYLVKLHDLSDYFGQRYENEGNYPIVPVGTISDPMLKAVLHEIKKHPIHLKIDE